MRTGCVEDQLFSREMFGECCVIFSFAVRTISPLMHSTSDDRSHDPNSSHTRSTCLAFGAGASSKSEYSLLPSCMYRFGDRVNVGSSPRHCGPTPTRITGSPGRPDSNLKRPVPIADNCGNSIQTQTLHSCEKRRSEVQRLICASDAGTDLKVSDKKDFVG
jgi:hypothetical protein